MNGAPYLYKHMHAPSASRSYFGEFGTPAKYSRSKLQLDNKSIKLSTAFVFIISEAVL
jgi:hypothetical protein